MLSLAITRSNRKLAQQLKNHGFVAELLICFSNTQGLLAASPRIASRSKSSTPRQNWQALSVWLLR
jgi:hypothetical protein